MLILGIESSCDETAAAVWSSSEKRILSNVIFSQLELHAAFGGVLPEIASRSHLEKIPSVVQEALDVAQVNWKDIDAVAVTNHPGLPGSLLVGVTFAKNIAWVGNKILLGVNHNHGHLASGFLTLDGQLRQDLEFPCLALSISGGHTSIFLMTSPIEFTLLSATIDDAIGEAFDKVAKMLGVEYPGGPQIEKMAALLDNQDFFKYPRGKERASLQLSFSGLKTAVLYGLVNQKAYDLSLGRPTDLLTQELKLKVASSFQVCIRDILLDKIAFALQQHPQVKAVHFVGGVACNKYLRQAIAQWCLAHDKQLHISPPPFCTDNGAMIATAAHFLLQAGHRSGWDLDIGRNIKN